MSTAKIFLVNIGANSAHSSLARCPIFSDGTFVYVPFPRKRGERDTRPYPNSAWPFTNGVPHFQTHADPDWENLTYGDNCANARAGSLAKAIPGDILLFWSLLWTNSGRDWHGFTGERGWYLIGALRVEEIVTRGRPSAISEENRGRAMQNAHLFNRKMPDGERVFIGDSKHSALFKRAVPFANPLTKKSLMYRAVRTKTGERLPLAGSKRWTSYLRTCRPVWDLAVPKHRKPAEVVRQEIQCACGFDLLKNLGS